MRDRTGVFVRFGIASFAIFFVLGGFSAAVFAQTSSGTITGTVFDPKQLVVTDASILIHDVDTGVDNTVMTNESGLYVASFLPPGHYEITADKQGFAKAVRKDVLLQVGETQTINFNMAVETAESTVTVTTETPLVEPEKTSVSQELSQTLVQNLPVFTRRWDSFVLLTPGVTNDGGSGLVSYRGISGLYNQNSVDGANNNQAFFGEAKGRAIYAFYTYSTDSIQEYQVSSSDYSAQYGQAAGGVVNAVTKSGTNAVHGDLFYNLRYPSLNALDPFSKGSAITTANSTHTAPAFSVPIHQQNQFGGSVGGPIVKDKLFYFGTYDGERRIAPITYTSTSQSSFPFTCAAITAAQCSEANSYIQGLLGSFSRSQKEDVYFARLDYQLNQSNRIFTDFNLSNWNSPSGYNPGPTSNNSSLTQNGPYTVYTRTFVTDWTSTLSSSSFNDFRFQWGRDLETAGANAPGPGVTITNVIAYGMPNALPRYAEPDEHRLEFTDTLSHIVGNHTFKFGVDVNVIHEYMANLFYGGGVYTFDPGAAALNFSDWAQDLFNPAGTQYWTTFEQEYDPITHIGADNFYNNTYAAFAEDTWKATRKLTLNLGLRYDVQVVPNPNEPNISTSLLALYSSKINVDKNNFGPRIGIAWQPTENTVVRLGYGIFYGLTREEHV